MNLKNLFTDEDAVSPVIGVILMVAITVILAAVIGAFVLGIGGSQEKVPSASFSFSVSDSFEADDTGDCNFTSVDDPADMTNVSVSHDGGEQIDGANSLKLKSGTSSAAWNNDDCGGSESVTAGDTASTTFDSSNDLNIVWESTESDKTSILATYSG